MKHLHTYYTHAINAIDTVQKILVSAFQLRASDIHIEALEKEFRVRYRIDGILHHLATIDTACSSQIIARIKILAHMDVAEKRLPQDGKIVISFQERSIDLRIATFPTLYGEKIVIRILDKSHNLLTLETIGLQTELHAPLRSIMHAPQGFFIITGPTGAGKTTTLYALILELISLNKNIVTLEDPIEYTLYGATQSQIAAEIGFTFARGLRALLRQDPDIIMIGEIRDKDTAEVALQAALTGHFVMSTLHTSDAAKVPFRLIDMGIEPFLLTSLSGIVSQKLVRLLCPDCKISRACSQEEQNFFTDNHFESLSKIYSPKGCTNCYFTGYKGRIGIFEFLIITQEIKNLFTHSIKNENLYDQIVARTIYPFIKDGLFKVKAGLICLDELRILLHS